MNVNVNPEKISTEELLKIYKRKAKDIRTKNGK